MAYVIYLSHPQVHIEKDVAIPNWSLSELGIERAAQTTKLPWTKSIDQIITSDETKALETAQCFANALSLKYVVGEDMGENDRSSTGFLPPEQFEHAADCFMNMPSESFRGWERAIDAQARIFKSVDAALKAYPKAEQVLFVGHGGVGTLLKCQLANRQIARIEDQPGNGGGNIFAFDLVTKSLLCDWTPMEEFAGISR